MKQVTLAVFPLQQLVFFPQTSKPLNIFEPRYIQMIEDCLENETLLALAMSEPPQVLKPAISTPSSPSNNLAGRSDDMNSHSELYLEGKRRTVGAGRVQLIERRSDQTMLIIVEALGKYHLSEFIETDKPYLTARAFEIEEVTKLEDTNLLLTSRIEHELKRWMESNVPDAQARKMFTQQLSTAEMKINYFCSLCVENPKLQQELLELNDINDRLLHPVVIDALLDVGQHAEH
jgi:uncharacterized protein